MDYFALLGQSRRPWLDQGELKASFLSRSAETHPDRVHGESVEEKEMTTARAAELNASHQCLSDTKERLAHLLELETGRRPENAQPSRTASGFFFTLAPVFREVDKFLAERAAAKSPLAKAQLYGAGLQWAEKLMALQREIQLRREGFEAELQAINSVWETAPALERAAELYGEFSFIKRWSEQIQERLARLAAD